MIEINLLKDKMISGFLAGCIGALAMNIIDWIGYLTGFHQEQLLDWSGVLIYGSVPSGFAETLFAQLAQISFGGFIGITFYGFFLKWLKGNHFVKGWIYGILSWFFIYAFSMLFDKPEINFHAFPAAFSHFLSASVYGIVMSLALRWLEQKADTTV